MRNKFDKDLNGARAFTDRAAAYAQARPGYPQAAIDFLFCDHREPVDIAVDVGAGTGIASMLLSERCKNVIAVDPNIPMLRAGSFHAHVGRVGGSAERLPLKNSVSAMLTVFNAFHWFEPDAFFLEAHRVLMPKGRLVLVWNDWQRNDPFTDAFVTLMHNCAVHRPEDRDAEVAPFYRTKLFGNVVHRSFENFHSMDLPTLRLRLKSVSYVPQEGTSWDELNTALTRLFHEWKDANGIVTHHYSTSVFVAQRLS